MAALLCFRHNISELEQLSTTDVKCYWKDHKTSALQNYEPVPIHDTPCFKKMKLVGNCLKYEQTIISEEKGTQILNTLIAAAPGSAADKHRYLYKYIPNIDVGTYLSITL